MANRLKNFLRFTNKILHEQPKIWMEREIPLSRITHPKFQQHRFSTINSLTEDLHNLYHNPYKVKTFLQVINSRLAAFDAFSKRYKPRRLIYPLFATAIGLGGYFIYKKVTIEKLSLENC